MSTAVLRNEDSLKGFLANANREINDPIYDIAVGDVDHKRLKEAVKRRKEQAEETPETKVDVLADYVLECLQSAKHHKKNTCTEWNLRESLRLREGRYTEMEIALIGGQYTNVWFPLTDRLCRGLSAFLRNIMTRDDENPNWEISPTPIPELPKDKVDFASEQIAEEILNQLALGFQITEEDLVEELDRVTDLLTQEIEDEAQAAAIKVTQYIRDLLEDADWREVFDALLDDLVTFGTAIVKGPYIVAGYDTNYNDSSRNKTRTRARKRIGVRNVDPQRLFPSSDSCDTQDGTFVIEISQFNRRDLTLAKKLDGFIADNIELVLTTLEYGERDWLCSHDVLDDLRGKRRSGRWTHDEKVDVVEYHGSLPGRLLAQLGVDHWGDGIEFDSESFYECEIFVVDGVVIRAIRNIDPEHQRPYHKATLFPTPGAFWGKGVPLVIRDIQRVVNAAWRSLVRNMGFSSAPIFELDHALWDTDVSVPPDNIEPGMKIDKNSLTGTDGRGRALDVIQINSRGEEFLRIIAQLIEHAEMTVNLPRFLQGDPSGGGGAARTLGGLATLQNNANVGLKSLVVDLDLDIIKPFIEMIYHWVQCTTEDVELRADAEVTVRGATHLLARELNKDRLLQTIGALFPFVEAGYVKSEGVSILLREVVRELGMEPDDVIVDQREARQREAQLQAALQQAGGISGGVGAAAQGPSIGPGGAAQAPQPAAPVQQPLVQTA